MNTLFPTQPLDIEARFVRLENLPQNETLHSEEPSAALVRSIEHFGLICPLILSGRLEVVDGIRRLKALRKLGATEAPCYVIVHDDVNVMALRIALNELRSPNLARTLEAIETLRAAGVPEATIEDATGLVPARYHRILGLLRLIPELRNALAGGQMRESTAEDASRLEIADQHKLLPVLAKRGKLLRSDVRDVHFASKAQEVSDLPASMFGTPDAKEDILGQREHHLLLDFARWLRTYEDPARVPEELVSAYLAAHPTGELPMGSGEHSREEVS